MSTTSWSKGIPIALEKILAGNVTEDKMIKLAAAMIINRELNCNVSESADTEIPAAAKLPDRDDLLNRLNEIEAKSPLESLMFQKITALAEYIDEVSLIHTEPNIDHETKAKNALHRYLKSEIASFKAIVRRENVQGRSELQQALATMQEILALAISAEE